MKKDTITTRFWSKHLGQYTVSQSYAYIANVIVVSLIFSIISILWCIILTVLIIK